MKKRTLKRTSKYALVALIVTSICILLCVRSRVQYAQALETSEDIIEGILGAKVGVTDADVEDIIDVIRGVLKVGNSQHKIPDKCPDNIKNEIYAFIDMSQTNDIIGTVDKWETILYGNGSFNTRVEFSIMGNKYYVNATKQDGKVLIGSMDRAIEWLAGLNVTFIGDPGIEVDETEFEADDTYDPVAEQEDAAIYDEEDVRPSVSDGEYINGIWYTREEIENGGLFSE